MKTYFMAFESDNKRGHCIKEFGDDLTPKEALTAMLEYVREQFSENEVPIQGVLTATQFNRVD